MKKLPLLLENKMSAWEPVDLFHGPQSTCSHVPSFLPQYVQAAGSQTLRLSQAFCLVDCSRHSLWSKPASTGSGGALHSAGTGRLTHLELAGLYFHAPAHPHGQLSSVNHCFRVQAHLGKDPEQPGKGLALDSFARKAASSTRSYSMLLAAGPGAGADTSTCAIQTACQAVGRH